MKKFILIMKLVFTGWLLMLLQVSASTYAQKVSIRVKNASLKEVLNQIQQQTKYDFIYDAEQVKSLRPITIQASDRNLTDVLNSCLLGQGFAFTLDNQVVTIRKVDRAAVDERQDLVKGVVMDESGKPLAGVSIRLRSTGANLAQTNRQGEFVLPAAASNQEIVFSFLGYTPKVQLLNPKEDRHVVRMVLEEGELDEVVISTGIFKKVDKSFTGASTTVTAKELQLFGTRNLITSLRNIDPSFNIIESNLYGSDPNRMPEIQIRGNSSIPNIKDLKNESHAELNTPLVILDGFESNLATLLDINENDVESITILKDATATAIYGSRGANGVVVITTKVPTAGKLRVSYGGMINFENPDLSGYTLLKAREKLELERLVGYYSDRNPDKDFSLKQYYNYILSEINRGVETDWLSIPLRTGHGQRHNLRVEGGDSRFRYAASAQYNKIAGVMRGSDRNTFNGGVTITYNYQNIRFRNDTKFKAGKYAQSPYGTFDNYSKQNPYWAPYNEDGQLNLFLGDSGDASSYGFYWNPLPANPLYNATLKTYDRTSSNDILNNTSIEWTIVKGLILRTQLGLVKAMGQSDRFRPAEHTAFANYSLDNVFRKGDYRLSTSNQFGYDAGVNLSFNKTFHKKHTIFGGVDFNLRHSENYRYNFLVEGFSNPKLDFLSMGLQYAKGSTPTGNDKINRAIGFTTNVNYIYDNRYFADMVYRKDGASQFGSKNRYAPFWSFGLGWNVHEEKFLKNNEVINHLKMRGSLGIAGSQNFDPYQAMTSYKYYTGDRYYNWNGAFLLGLGNEQLKWQQTFKKNIGFDAEFLDRKLKLKLDVYEETTEGLISTLNLPASNGFTSYTENVGRVGNKGVESSATVVLLNNPQSFFWSITGGLVRNKNKVLETSEELKKAQATTKARGDIIGNVYEEGYSSKTIWVVPSMGIDPSTGMEVFRGIDGEPTLTWSGRDVVAMGSTEPTLFGNFSTLIRYKDITLNTAFRYSFGAQQYNSTLADKVEVTDYKYNVDQRVFDDRWKEPGDVAAFKGLLVNTPTYKSSRFVQNESLLAISNIHLQYDVRGKAWMRAMRLNMLSVTANMSEPLYLSTIRRERGTSYPFARQYSLGFNVTF
ncbi:SusC/RagA family TonB-linked outer membrane protein [Sphingobacterium faecale]|uniref:SusC/RagA family TonB-linked outer membrane protein n=1 Tax=Sphingobacterium faecale TaxID=2803775 RepID=A0ABS1R448_9SPHI|nr:SusC/RagA family TonB-linked outer membrane protein [Sphingobacterium faecale]MBL1409490.1 SusC/RagA family TonB-linked outer membrane protein [Sphingobacterium faecale]